jgi:hypothetical protein
LSVLGPAEVDLRPFSGLRALRKLVLMHTGHPVDLSPLADHDISIDIRGTSHTGAEELGPGVKLTVG